MSARPLTHASLLSLREAREPVRKTVRRLRWFKTSFSEQVEEIASEIDIGFALDEPRLAAAFIDWLRSFEAQKPNHPESRRGFVGFAAGLMLRALIKHAPLTAITEPDHHDDSNPGHLWPEGYVYVAYCLNVRAAVLEQDFDETIHITPSWQDPETWRSFKENVREDPNLGIAFLDLFAGEDPHWTMPELFRVHDVKRIAAHLLSLESAAIVQDP